MKILRFLAFLSLFIGLLLFGFVLNLYLGNETYRSTVNATTDTDKLGSLGSLLSGLVGTLWSLGSVLLFYVALREQREDMKINKQNLEVQTKALEKQVEEFELQRAELSETRKVYKEQSETQQLQRFESTFFQMISLHHSLVDGMLIRNPNPGTNRVGRDCFKSLSAIFGRKFKLNTDKNPEFVISNYMELFDEYQSLLGHYFRNLYHIYKFINKSDGVDKKFYAALVRAQLSSFELELLFYNCLSNHGNKKFKPLVEQYAILKNIDRTDIYGGEEILKQYKPNAYGQNNYVFLV